MFITIVNDPLHNKAEHKHVRATVTALHLPVNLVYKSLHAYLGDTLVCECGLTFLDYCGRCDRSGDLSLVFMNG